MERLWSEFAHGDSRRVQRLSQRAAYRLIAGLPQYRVVVMRPGGRFCLPMPLTRRVSHRYDFGASVSHLQYSGTACVPRMRVIECRVHPPCRPARLQPTGVRPPGRWGPRRLRAGGRAGRPRAVGDRHDQAPAPHAADSVVDPTGMAARPRHVDGALPRSPRPASTVDGFSEPCGRCDCLNVTGAAGTECVGSGSVVRRVARCPADPGPAQ